MARYAKYDPAISTNSPVLGWYDTNQFVYKILPPSTDLILLSDAQWANRLNGRWAVTNGQLVPYAPPAPSAAETAVGMIRAGLTIIRPTILPGGQITFRTDPTTNDAIQAEVISILLNDTFADGETTITWPYVTAGQTAPALTVAQFKIIASAIAVYVSKLMKVIAGGSTTLPVPTVTLP